MGIQNFKQSGKKDDPFKVGKFGIGFNSVYHITGGHCLNLISMLQYKRIVMRIVCQKKCHDVARYPFAALQLGTAGVLRVKVPCSI